MNEKTRNKLADILGPSQFSATGYLGSDTRTPERIIADDAETMRGLGLTNKAAAAVLRKIFTAAEINLGNPVKLSDNVTAVYEDARGQIPSPFTGDGAFQKGRVLIEGLDNNYKAVITSLSIHLIERYGFFQGKGSEYRIEPQAVSMLGHFQ